MREKEVSHLEFVLQATPRLKKYRDRRSRNAPAELAPDANDTVAHASGDVQSLRLP